MHDVRSTRYILKLLFYTFITLLGLCFTNEYKGNAFASGQSSGSCGLVKFEILEDDLIQGPYKKSLMIMVNIAPYLEDLNDLNSKQLYSFFKSHSCMITHKNLGQEWYKGLKKSLVSFVVIENLDEYGEENFDDFEMVVTFEYELDEYGKILLIDETPLDLNQIQKN